MIAPVFHRWLQRVPAPALREAMHTPFDVLELVAIASGLIVLLLQLRGAGSPLAAIAWPALIAAFLVGRRALRALSRTQEER